MKVLITGSSGFIGKRVCSLLLEKGHEIIGVDKVPPADPTLKNYHLQCDILGLDKLIKVFKDHQPDCVLHLASRTDLGERKHINGYASNIDGVRNVIRAIQKTPSVKRAVYTSSQLVCKVGYVPKNIDEYCPNTLYGRSKVLSEKIIREEDGGGIEWCIARPTTVWGPHMNPHYQRFLKLIQEGHYFHVGKGKLFKSYGYVGNIAFQYLKLLTAPREEIHRRVFYLADYQPLSLREYTNALQKEMKAPLIPTYPASLARLFAFMGDFFNFIGWKSFSFNSFHLNNIVTEYIFDMKATEEVCGPLPHTFEEGVKETVQWFLSNDKQ